MYYIIYIYGILTCILYLKELFKTNLLFWICGPSSKVINPTYTGSNRVGIQYFDTSIIFSGNIILLNVMGVLYALLKFEDPQI